jgi:hypothetical protein
VTIIPPYDAQITELTKEWMSLIGGDHHKDRDCHFYVTKKWSYGGDPVYEVEHQGYVAERVEQEFPTAKEAHLFLIQLLTDIIHEERQLQERYRREMSE